MGTSGKTKAPRGAHALKDTITNAIPAAATQRRLGYFQQLGVSTDDLKERAARSRLLEMIEPAWPIQDPTLRARIKPRYSRRPQAPR